MCAILFSRNPAIVFVKDYNRMDAYPRRCLMPSSESSVEIYSEFRWFCPESWAEVLPVQLFLVDITLAAFVEVLHSAIKDGLTEGIDETQKSMAMQTNHGWMHIHGMSNFWTETANECFFNVDRPTQHTSSQPNRGSRWYHWNSSSGKQWGTLTVKFVGNDLRLIATVDSPRDVPTYARVSFGDIWWTYATDSRTCQKATSYLIEDCWSRESFIMNEWVMRYPVKVKWENKKRLSGESQPLLLLSLRYLSFLQRGLTPFNMRPWTKIWHVYRSLLPLLPITSNIMR